MRLTVAIDYSKGSTALVRYLEVCAERLGVRPVTLCDRILRQGTESPYLTMPPIRVIDG